MRVTKIASLIAAILLACVSVAAQDRKPLSLDEQSKYIVSAGAGVVNLVVGEATVTGAEPDALPDRLIAGDELRLNDVVRTGPGGRAEILLNPGCYLRLDENSEFVFLFDGFTRNKMKLLRGSAIIEASVIDGILFVETPKAKFDIVRKGLYRFNIETDGKAEVFVRKGMVFVGNTQIKEGKRAVIDANSLAIAKLDKKEVDELDDWSKERARTLIAANRNLSKSGMRRSLSRSFLSNAWIYDPFCRCYTFLPSTSGFGSPYGWNYSTCNPYWYRVPRYDNGWSRGGGYVGGNPGGGGSTSGGGNSGGGGGGSVSRPTPPAAPSEGSRGNLGGGAAERGVSPAAPSGSRRP
jgi:uncharacterized membrane protein YgcG